MDWIPMVASGENPDRPDAPTAASIRAALGRVLASDAFRGAPQLTAFLGFIVERALAGRGAELKGYTIAVEAFGRPAEFDPQTDPIVRVEAGRLRKALMQYYAGEGAGDALRIAIPVGGYVPTFALAAAGVEPAPGAPASGAPPDDAAATSQPPPAAPVSPRPAAASARAGPGPVRLAAIGLALLAAVLAAALAVTIDRVGDRRDAGLQAADPRPSAAPAPAASSPGAAEAPPPAAARPGHLPVVAVTVNVSAADTELAEATQRFARLLIDAMARFDDLVAIRTPPAGLDGADASDYVFEIDASRVGTAAEGFGRLRSVKDGRIVWTNSAIRALSGGIDQSELDELARRLAIRLAEPFGVIHADFRQLASAPAMRCIFLALDVRRTMQAADHLAARTCLEELLARDETFHAAWSHLALLTLDEYLLGFNPQPGPPLDRALSAALTAVRLAPSSARAQQAMMDVLFVRGMADDAIAAGRAALARNPYDPDIMADLGSRYVRLNRPVEGLPLLSRAVELSAGRPPWYDFYAFLGAHLMGAERLAESYSAALVADNGVLSLLGRALGAAKANDPVEVVACLRHLAAADPLFAIDTRLYLARKGFAPDLIDRVIADLGPDSLSAAVRR